MILSSILKSTTALVTEVANGSLTIQAFAQKYGNFYYCAALDGHEASESEKCMMKEFMTLIEFHEKVQNIVDIIYWGGDDMKPIYLKAGRVTPEEGLERLRDLVVRYDLKKEIELITKNEGFGGQAPPKDWRDYI